MSDEPEIKTLLESSQMTDMRESIQSSPLCADPVQIKDHRIALGLSGMVTAGVISLAIVFGSSTTFTGPVVAHEEVVTATIPPVQRPDVANPFARLELTAKSYIVYDVQASKTLFGHNAEKVRPLASLTKLMTSLVAIETADPAMRLAIEEYAIDTEGDSGLFANETWTLRNLVAFTMLTSSNDGADALAASVGGLLSSSPETLPSYERVDLFVDKMNARAQELGLSSTKYRNATGLDEPAGRLGGEGSAEDMAKLIAYAWQHAPESVAHTGETQRTFVSEDGFVHPARNTNEYVYSTPGMLASKTGYTDMAGGNLAILYNSGLDHPIAVVVLGSTVDGRFSDVQQLVDATYEYIESGWYDYEVAGSTSNSL